MNKIYFVAAVIAAVAVTSIRCSNETPSEQCPGLHFDNLREKITVSPCGKSRCKLRTGTNITVVLKFTPDNEVKSLTNKVHANIGELSLPFFGVTETSACEHLTRADDDQPVTCPLAAGQEYVYTNVFHVEKFYPQTPLRVHWGLNDGKKDIICFEVPAVITK